MSRAVPLTAINGGINRLRVKGGARADVLYDLLNGYVTEAGTIVVRPGTERKVTLPSTTRGLVFFKLKFHTFSHQVETMPSALYVCHIITHPTDPTLTLTKIHFTKPYLGFLYVVAEFSNGDIRHFWLGNSGVWQANKTYKAGDAVLASTDTGLLYRATRATAPNPSWAAGVGRTLGESIEPTTYNDFYYTVTAVEGSARSGATEPTWPTDSGATVTEESDTEGSASSGVTFPPATSVPSAVSDRYGRG